MNKLIIAGILGVGAAVATISTVVVTKSIKVSLKAKEAGLSRKEYLAAEKAKKAKNVFLGKIQCTFENACKACKSIRLPGQEAGEMA
jgi:predicted ribonuclease YlaK